MTLLGLAMTLLGMVWQKGGWMIKVRATVMLADVRLLPSTGHMPADA